MNKPEYKTGEEFPLDKVNILKKWEQAGGQTPIYTVVSGTVDTSEETLKFYQECIKDSPYTLVLETMSNPAFSPKWINLNNLNNK